MYGTSRWLFIESTPNLGCSVLVEEVQKPGGKLVMVGDEAKGVGVTQAGVPRSCHEGMEWNAPLDRIYSIALGLGNARVRVIYSTVISASLEQEAIVFLKLVGVSTEYLLVAA